MAPSDAAGDQGSLCFSFKLRFGLAKATCQGALAAGPHKKICSVCDRSCGMFFGISPATHNKVRKKAEVCPVRLTNLGPPSDWRSFCRWCRMLEIEASSSLWNPKRYGSWESCKHRSAQPGHMTSMNDTHTAELCVLRVVPQLIGFPLGSAKTNAHLPLPPHFNVVKDRSDISS